MGLEHHHLLGVSVSHEASGWVLTTPTGEKHRLGYIPDCLPHQLVGILILQYLTLLLLNDWTQHNLNSRIGWGLCFNDVIWFCSSLPPICCMPQDFLFVLNTPFSFLFLQKICCSSSTHIPEKIPTLDLSRLSQNGRVSDHNRCFQETKALHVRPPQRYSAPMNLGQWPPQIQTPIRNWWNPREI